MKLNEKQLRKIIEEATLGNVSEQEDLVLMLIPFVCRGDLDFAKTERFFNISVISESETPGNRCSYVAWKSMTNDEEAVERAEELATNFRDFVTFYDDSRGHSYVKSWHTLVHLVGPDTTVYNSAFPDDPGYMFDGVDCSNSELKTMGIL